MNFKMSSFVLLMCGILPFAYSYTCHQESVKSNNFEPVRPKHPPKSISACDTLVTEPYGQLEKTYKRGQVEKGSSCTWTLRAPANHVVNIISVTWELLDENIAEKPGRHYHYSGSQLDLYDSDQTLLSRFQVNAIPRPVGSPFLRSLSSKQEMVVRITYDDSVDFAIQQIFIKYEFLKSDDIKRLL